MRISDQLRFAIIVLAAIALIGGYSVAGQTTQRAKAELGSRTAKNGFQNEKDIQEKFNNWETDSDARAWLRSMKYNLADIQAVRAVRPSGEKADVEVFIKTKAGETKEGISIKLVSGPNGFNQIDKRWLSHYVKMWKMPAVVEAALKSFVGEAPPDRPSREKSRMFLDELDPASKKAVVDYFSADRERILHDLFAGDGPHAAKWFMVAQKSVDDSRWILKTDKEAVQFFGEGKVEITSRGNLKIGRVTMQRKGGDAGRDTAKMLQFKINPALLFGKQ